MFPTKLFTGSIQSRSGAMTGSEDFISMPVRAGKCKMVTCKLHLWCFVNRLPIISSRLARQKNRHMHARFPVNETLRAVADVTVCFLHVEITACCCWGIQGHTVCAGTGKVLRCSDGGQVFSLAGHTVAAWGRGWEEAVVLGVGGQVRVGVVFWGIATVSGVQRRGRIVILWCIGR